MGKREDITIERLKDVLSYDPATGTWTWRVSRGKRSAGSVAGCSDGDGYIQIQIDGVQYKAHNLAFLWMVGRWPRPMCDHRDLDKKNNRWANLRDAEHFQNSANIALTRRNTSGFKGVAFDKVTQSWKAQAQIKGKTIWIGRFAKAKDASIAYFATIKEALGEFAREA